MKSPRQFRVTHPTTGLITYVTVDHDLTGNGFRNAAVRAGFSQDDYYQRRVRVHLVRPGFERPQAFDELPLIIRRGHKNGVAS